MTNTTIAAPVPDQRPIGAFEAATTIHDAIATHRPQLDKRYGPAAVDATLARTDGVFDDHADELLERWRNRERGNDPGGTVPAAGADMFNQEQLPVARRALVEMMRDGQRLRGDVIRNPQEVTTNQRLAGIVLGQLNPKRSEDEGRGELPKYTARHGSTKVYGTSRRLPDVPRGQ